MASKIKFNIKIDKIQQQKILSQIKQGVRL